MRLGIDATVAIDSAAVSQLQQYLWAAASRTTDFYPAFTFLRDDIHAHYVATFEGSGAVDGYPRWHPWSKEWAWLRLKRNIGGSLLILTGELAMSLLGRTVFKAEKIGTQEMYVGTTHPAAKYHITGTKYMPARPFIRFGGNRLQAYAAYLGAYIVGELFKKGKRIPGSMDPLLHLTRTRTLLFAPGVQPTRRHPMGPPVDYPTELQGASHLPSSPPLWGRVWFPESHYAPLRGSR